MITECTIGPPAGTEISVFRAQRWTHRAVHSVLMLRHENGTFLSLEIGILSYMRLH